MKAPRRSPLVDTLLALAMVTSPACGDPEPARPAPASQGAEAPGTSPAPGSVEPPPSGEGEGDGGGGDGDGGVGLDSSEPLKAALADADSLPLRSREAVQQFYEAGEFRPVWVRDGRATDAAMATLQVLEQLPAHGFDPARYGVPALAGATPSAEDPNSGPAFELRLTDTWLTVGAHLLRGRIDPVTIHPEWSASARTQDLIQALRAALASGSPAQALSALAPSHPEYATLQGALAALREQQEVGPWPRIPGPDPLSRGSHGPAVAALRARLARTDGLADGTGDAFDDDVAAAVRHFQERHGIEVTGRVDEPTRRALDVTIDQRIGQVVASLERWRWLPEQLGERHVRVNIAAFDVTVFDGQAATLSMRAVVGKRYRKTPVFSTDITQVTINPRWTAPPKLAVRDLLPEIKKDPTTIARKGLRVFDAKTGAEVDASKISWGTLSAKRFPYIIKQEPGADNALGRFRFGMPNAHDVFLHDTPKRHLFAEDKRTYSSGCVRLQRPRDLAVTLLAGHPKWTPAKLDSAVADGRELTIRLPTPVPVHLLYWTAFVDGEGRLQLRDDVYGRDAALLKALAEGADPGG